MSLDRFEIISTIYNTLEDSLLLVKKKEDGKIYTIKSVRVDENREKEKQLFFNELRILVPLTHKNIIMYKEAFYDKETKTLNMVIEYIGGGDLSMKIKLAQQKKKYFKEKVIWGVFIQILEGLNYLHKKFIIHRDLKTSNIYLTKKGIVKIGGLNVGKNIEEIGMALTQIGTPYFTAPEIWEQKAYDYKCDIWSLGCILYEMSSLHVPFLGLDMQELYQNITSLKYSPIPKCYSKELGEIIKIILNKNPIDRPSTKELLNHKIIVKKIEELNFNIDNRDEYSEINQNLNKIIQDYNNKATKLDNSHVIFKKSDKKPENMLKQGINKIERIQINNNSNNNLMLDDITNARTKSDFNKYTNININIDDKIIKEIKGKKIIKNNINKNRNDPNYNKKFIITDYNFMKNNNYSCSALNQNLSRSYILNSSAGKIFIKNNNKEMNINNYNYFKLENKKKNNYNLIKNNNYLNLNPNKEINTKRIVNNDNYNKDKNMINNELLKKKANKIIIFKNKINYINKSFQKNNKINIKINNDKNNKNYNLMNNLENQLNINNNVYKTPSSKDRFKYKTKNIFNKNNNLERNFTSNHNLNYNITNNQIYLNKNIKKYNFIPIKYINLTNGRNDRNIINLGVKSKIGIKNNESYIEKKNFIKIPMPFYKNKSNENFNEKIDIKKYNNIRTNSQQNKMNKMKDNNCIINNQANKNKKIKVRNFNNNNNKIFRINKSPMIRRNIDKYFDNNNNIKIGYSFQNTKEKLIKNNGNLFNLETNILKNNNNLVYHNYFTSNNNNNDVLC